MGGNVYLLSSICKEMQPGNVPAVRTWHFDAKHEAESGGRDTECPLSSSG